MELTTILFTLKRFGPSPSPNFTNIVVFLGLKKLLLFKEKMKDIPRILGQINISRTIEQKL